MNLEQILESHAKWLMNDPEGERANLQDADLRGADLQDANLRGANLWGANLQDANLQGANLQGADLRGADLRGAKLPYFAILPESGQFIGWKKVKGAVLKLLIPEDAARTNSLVGRKCRASKVFVLEAFPKNEARQVFFSKYNPSFVYEVNRTIIPNNYNPDIRVECAEGIHFFITRQEAEEYE